MHILFLPSWYPKNPQDVGGVFFREQALALHQHGHKVGVIAPRIKPVRQLFDRIKDPHPPHFELDAGLPTYRNEAVMTLPRLPYGSYWIFKRTAQKLFCEYIADHGMPDIIHAHAAIFGGAVAVDIAKEAGIPVALTEHSSGFGRGVYSSWQLKLAEKAIGGSQALIAVSPSLGDTLGDQFALSKGQWKWIPNVVAERFEAPENVVVQDRPFRFLNLALMTENKGHSDLIKAFGLASKQNVSAELWLAGDGAIRAQLESLAKNLGIADKVRFLGAIPPDSVPKLLSEVDVMVISSHYETFGVVAAEALMAGVPVIATRCGGPECIVGKEDGLLVPPKQPEVLCKAMQEIYQDLPRYNRTKIAMRAKNRFSGQSVAAQITNEYIRVLSSAAEVKG